MSADNWAICPRCHTKRTASGYSEVPALKEYFSVETDEDGIFSVEYSCQCTECGFAFKFNHKEEVPVEQTRKKGSGT